MSDLPDPWAGMDGVLSRSEVAAMPPQIDPRSPHGFIVVGLQWLRQHLRGKASPILRMHLTGESADGRRFWFRDLPGVRQELGME